MTLAGRIALVTGGSRGIGRAAAEALAAEGVRVAVSFRSDKDGAFETAEACEGSTVVRLDVTDPASVEDAFAEVELSLGPVDILVNNAGLRKDGLLLRMSEQDWADVVETDLTSVFRCTKRALPGMLKTRWGRVITIGSAVATTGNAGQCNYGAAKAGVEGFTRSLAREVARRGITANVVAPGLVDTALTADLSDAARASLVERIPLERAASPEEIGEAVRFCARASYLTGQTIHIDGGIS